MHFYIVAIVVLAALTAGAAWFANRHWSQAKAYWQEANRQKVMAVALAVRVGETIKELKEAGHEEAAELFKEALDSRDRLTAKANEIWEASDKGERS